MALSFLPKDLYFTWLLAANTAEALARIMTDFKTDISCLVIPRGGNASHRSILFPAYFMAQMEPGFLDVVNTAWYLVVDRSLLSTPMALQAGTTG